MKKPVKAENFFERRTVAIPLNAVLFITNFFLVYFVLLMSFRDTAGLWRVIACWATAYGLTWMMTYLSKGVWRLFLTLLLLGVLLFVLIFHR